MNKNESVGPVLAVEKQKINKISYLHTKKSMNNKHVQGHGDQPKYEIGNVIIITVDSQFKTLNNTLERISETDNSKRKKNTLDLKTFWRYDTLYTLT